MPPDLCVNSLFKCIFLALKQFELNVPPSCFFASSGNYSQHISPNHTYQEQAQNE